MTHDRNSSYESPIEQTQAREVEYCPRPDCGSPVVSAPGGMEEHVKRCHSAPVAAKPGINVRRWEREW